jgi:hypothetical protein
MTGWCRRRRAGRCTAESRPAFHDPPYPIFHRLLQHIMVFIGPPLHIQRCPLPTPTTETTHLTPGSTAVIQTAVAPPSLCRRCPAE